MGLLNFYAAKKTKLTKLTENVLLTKNSLKLWTLELWDVCDCDTNPKIA